MPHINRTSEYFIKLIVLHFLFLIVFLICFLFFPTFLLSRYKLVFVPFTAIDNHNRNVTFGGALLGSEAADSYRWLLTKFVNAFGKEPQVVVTDQDPAMKRAIKDVLPRTRHRLCMWHIWDKLKTKVPNCFLVIVIFIKVYLIVLCVLHL